MQRLEISDKQLRAVLAASVDVPTARQVCRAPVDRQAEARCGEQLEIVAVDLTLVSDGEDASGDRLSEAFENRDLARVACDDVDSMPRCKCLAPECWRAFHDRSHRRQQVFAGAPTVAAGDGNLSASPLDHQSTIESVGFEAIRHGREVTNAIGEIPWFIGQPEQRGAVIQANMNRRPPILWKPRA
jgi:hypothetical protein